MNLYTASALTPSPVSDLDRYNRVFDNLQVSHDRRVRANEDAAQRRRDQELRDAQTAHLQNVRSQGSTEVPGLPYGDIAPMVNYPDDPAPAPQGQTPVPDGSFAPGRGPLTGAMEKQRANQAAADEQRFRAGNAATPPPAKGQLPTTSQTYPQTPSLVRRDGRMARLGLTTPEGVAAARAQNAADEAAVPHVPAGPYEAPQSSAETERLLRSGNRGAYDAAPAAGLPAPGAPARSAVQGSSPYDRPTQYDDLIQAAAISAGIDPIMFKRLIGTESSFRPDAVSPRGASYGLGIAQIAASHGLSDADRNNPAVVLPFSANLLAKYIADAGGDVREGVLRYKGAVSEKGRAAMGAVFDSKIAGGTSDKLMSSAQAGQAPKSPTKEPSRAQLAKESVEALRKLTPEQFTMVSGRLSDEAQLTEMRLQQANSLLQTAPDITTANSYLAQINALRYEGRENQLRQATLLAASGDPRGMAQLAQAAGVSFARTNKGYVVINQDGSQSKPIDGMVLANALYDRASGAAQRRAQQEHASLLKQQEEMAKIDAKGAADITLAGVQGGIARAAESNKPRESKFSRAGADGPTYVERNGQLYEVRPGADLGPAGVGLPTLVPIGAQ